MLYQFDMTEKDRTLLGEGFEFAAKVEYWKSGASNANSILVQKAIEKYEVVAGGSVKCCYCNEWVKLPYDYVVDKKSAKLVGAMKDGKQFTHFTQPFKGTKMGLHPHAKEGNVCMGTFAGQPDKVVDALTLGLNPGSPYFNIADWLHVLGHYCPDMGKPCPSHGYECKELPERIERETLMRRRFSCEPVIFYYHEEPCIICNDCQPMIVNDAVMQCENTKLGEGLILRKGRIFADHYPLSDYAKLTDISAITTFKMLENELYTLRTEVDISKYRTANDKFNLTDEEDLELFMDILKRRTYGVFTII